MFIRRRGKRVGITCVKVGLPKFVIVHPLRSRVGVRVLIPAVLRRPPPSSAILVRDVASSVVHPRAPSSPPAHSDADAAFDTDRMFWRQMPRTVTVRAMPQPEITHYSCGNCTSLTAYERRPTT